MTRKTIRCILAIVMVICIIAAMPPPAKAAPEGGTSSAAVVLETGTNRVLFESNPNAQMPMASTTKIMTALVALEYGNLDDKVVIPREAVGIEGSSIYLKEGEVLQPRNSSSTG